jgi:hypothetical protein
MAIGSTRRSKHPYWNAVVKGSTVDDDATITSQKIDFADKK